MISSQELQKLESLFSRYPELKEAASLFLQNNLTYQTLKDCVKSAEDVNEIAASLKLTIGQKLQLNSVLLDNTNTLLNTQGQTQNLSSDIFLNKAKETKNISLAENTKAEDSQPKEKTTKKIVDDQTKPSKPKKFPKVVINTTRSRGELKLLKAIIEKNKAYGWKEATGYDGDVMWSGLDIPWEGTEISKEIRLNRIPGMKDLSHKKTTGFYLNKFREYYPEEFDFFPRTFLIPEETEEFRDFIKENPEKLFIAKPTAGSQGDGIILVKKFSDLPSANEMVVQEYVDKPLLLDGKKFDLRLYVLVSNVKPMMAFLNEEGLARFCTENYQTPTKDNLKNSYMHLTNYSLNKLSPNYKYTEECLEINEGTKRTLTSLWKSLEKAGHSKEEILENIKSLLKRLLVSLQPIIQFNYNVAFEGKDTGKCFHVIGVDVLIDQDLKPWLLEINGNPSLNIGHEDSTDPKAKEIISPVDKFVKEKVIEDTLLIVRKSLEKQAELEKYRTFELIYNSQDGDFEEMEIFKDILEIFGKLSGVRFKTHLVSTKFVKLASISGMTNEHLIKASYDIIYQKALKGSDDNQMSFSTFIRAIEEVAATLHKGSYDPNDKNFYVERVITTIKSGLSI